MFFIFHSTKINFFIPLFSFPFHYRPSFHSSTFPLFMLLCFVVVFIHLPFSFHHYAFPFIPLIYSISLSTLSSYRPSQQSSTTFHLFYFHAPTLVPFTSTLQRSSSTASLNLPLNHPPFLHVSLQSYIPHISLCCILPH